MKEQVTKQTNNAIDQVKGSLHQFYIALDLCYELEEGEKLFIETYGDVTIENKIQIEVKKYKKQLTDLDQNIWNTLNNWLENYDEFKNYKVLMLNTTQEISKDSILYKKSYDEEKGIIKDIKEEYLKEINVEYQNRKKKDKKTEKLINSVLEAKKSDQLKKILEKTVIQPLQLFEEKLWKDLIKKRAAGMDENVQENFLNFLLGFITNPKTVSEYWEIEYSVFQGKLREAMSYFVANSKVFPRLREDYTNNQCCLDNKLMENLFIKKIKEIEYEAVIEDAIKDYLYRKNLLVQEAKRYELLEGHYTEYEEQLINKFKIRRRKEIRKVEGSTLINKSQDFYDDIMEDTSITMGNYMQVAISFKNGTLHELADDRERNIKWLLSEEGGETDE